MRETGEAGAEAVAIGPATAGATQRAHLRTQSGRRCPLVGGASSQQPTMHLCAPSPSCVLSRRHWPGLSEVRMGRRHCHKMPDGGRCRRRCRRGRRLRGWGSAWDSRVTQLLQGQRQWLVTRIRRPPEAVQVRAIGVRHITTQHGTPVWVLEVRLVAVDQPTIAEHRRLVDLMRLRFR